MKDVIIIGGGPAGLTAALYASRSGLSVLLLESDNVGGQIASAPLVENYPGTPQISGMLFADQLFEQVMGLGVAFELEKAVEIIDNGSHKTVVTEDGRHDARSVIIATGAKHRHLGVAREAELVGRGISYCAVCDGAFYKNKTVAVVGGGNSAICEALFLSSICEKVYLIHRRSEFRADVAIVNRLKSLPNVTFLTGCVVDALEGAPSLHSIILRSVETHDVSTLEIDALFVAIGHAPDNSAFVPHVTLDDEGYIIAAEDGTTNTSGIFVAGDCRKKAVRQLTTAVGDGANAATSAWGCNMNSL
ncbi:MAG TPA: FAD-dependent oxidoreductase [Clostridiaceae bacterium]|nr:FAD-dependent oxidoreductase [Clostridiaceae bacterium]